MAHQLFMINLGYAVLGMAQLSNALLITVTTHRACPTTTTATLPACGWISTSGTSRSYCFSTSTSSRSLSTTGMASSMTASFTTAMSSSTSTAPVVSVTVTPLPSSSSVPPVSLPSPISSSSVPPVSLPSSISSSSVPPVSLPSPVSSSSVPPVSLPSPISTDSVSTVSVTVTPLPSSTSSAELPPVYTDPIITSTTSSSTQTTLTTISAPPVYESPSTSVDCGVLGLNCPVSTTPASASTATTLATISGPPGYEGPTTSTSTVPTPTNPAELGYCFQNGALLDINVNITITDNLGSVYALLCTSTSLGVSLTGADLLTVPAPNSVDDCFVACDDNDLCSGFTFQSIAPWGVGPGTCYLYQGLGLAFEATLDANLIAFIRLDLLSKRLVEKRSAVREIESVRKSYRHGTL